MRATSFFLSTLKEPPADADVVSQQFMIRSGMINKAAAGIYTYMPLGLRVLNRIEAIVREEMNRAGAIELRLPVVQPAELWQASGRWDKYGPELLRLKDRHARDFVIQPTAEEAITDFVHQTVSSYKQLPLNFYQIQTKFRDERRPRFGVMRGREFVMKDAYSFDRDAEGAAESYRKMYEAYVRIFTRLGLKFRAVAADTGAIGGSRSHEFQVIARTGEDVIAYCEESDFAANIELAPAPCLIAERAAPTRSMAKAATPGCEKCELVAEYLKEDFLHALKAVVLASDRTDAKGAPAKPVIVLVMLRADHDLNEVKAGKLPELAEGFRFATDEEIVAAFGSKPGYLGPVGVKDVVVYADATAANVSDFICGANEEGYHLTGVNWGRDLPEPKVADLRNVVEGDASPDGKGAIRLERGIEVGHVFYLGRKYSEVMGATYLDESGKAQVFEMGCYGIGVSRLMGAIIEQCHDDKGIVWPESVAPFSFVICPMNYAKSEAVRKAADKLYSDMTAAGLNVILDDRDLRPGVMFADWELIGVPHRVVVGDRGLVNGELEYVHRASLDKREMIALEGAVETLAAKLS